MKPLKHQIKKAQECWNKLLKYRYAYLQGLPRAGKTLTAILTVEHSKRIQSILVLTPKAAISGWLKFINNQDLKPYITKKYHVTNYEQIGKKGLRTHAKNGNKLKNPVKELQLKLNPNDYDFVIIDESHRLGKIGKPTNRYQLVKKLCWELPHIHLSGTAIVESPNSIYYQMHISKFSPFEGLNSFYEYFREYGKPSQLVLGNPMDPNVRTVAKYDLYQDKLLPYIEEFTVRMTQDDAGISKDVQASDTIHYVQLDESTRKLYNKLQKDRILEINGHTLICDTTMKLRTSLHQLEGGVLKIDDNTTIFVGNTERIDFIKKTFGDHHKLGIMAHFIGERKLLETHFRNAEIYSSTSHAEGVDLSHLKDFVIYSSGYSGSKFIQRRERAVNVNQTSKVVVEHLVSKGAISEQVYFTCADKNDFNNKTYKKAYL